MIREVIFLKGERDLWISFAERCDDFIMIMWSTPFPFDTEKIIAIS